MFDDFVQTEFVPTTLETTRTKMERKDILMDPVQTSICVIGGIVDYHPYRPTMRIDSFGVLTENQKEKRIQLTKQLYKDTTNNILQMNKDRATEVSPYFLPSPNQLNKIKANLKKIK